MGSIKTLVEFSFEQLPRMSHVERYSGVPKFSHESIASHSYDVVFLVMAVSDYLRDLGVSVIAENAMRMAILHDIEEIVSGDIVSPFKTGRFAHELMLKNSNTMIDVSMAIQGENRFSYYGLWQEMNARSSIEAQVADLCDKLQVAIHCVKEIRLGNAYFSIILKNITSTIKDQEFTDERLRDVADKFVEYIELGNFSDCFSFGRK